MYGATSEYDLYPLAVGDTQARGVLFVDFDYLVSTDVVAAAGDVRSDVTSAPRTS